jgi:hypothetical protein
MPLMTNLTLKQSTININIPMQISLFLFPPNIKNWYGFDRPILLRRMVGVTNQVSNQSSVYIGGNDGGRLLLIGVVVVCDCLLLYEQPER